MELYRVRELLLIILANEDLNPVLVALIAKRGRYLASDILVLEE